MDMDRSLIPKTEGSIRRSVTWKDLPPTQAGLAAALRRAYVLPADEMDEKFAELLRELN